MKEAQDELIRRAKLEFAENHIDELKASYRINFIYLEQTEEYKEYIKNKEKYILDKENIDINKIYKYLRNKDSINAHLVNPIYIKGIDALNGK